MFSTRIAYVTRGGGRFTLRVADADGEGGQVALNSAEPIISPAWSPNGRELAYVSFESQKAVVYTQDVATGNRRAVANFRGSNSAPAWSPDSQTLAVTLSRDSGSQLYLIGRDGENVRRLTTSQAIDTEPVFAPDGKTIYFVSDRGGSPQIYKIGVGGGAVERVTSAAPTTSARRSARWRTLAFISRSANAFRLHQQDLGTGGQATALTDTSDDESPSFAPNGRLIIYATRAQGRSFDDDHAGWKIKARLASAAATCASRVLGPVRALNGRSPVTPRRLSGVETPIRTVLQERETEASKPIRSSGRPRRRARARRLARAPSSTPMCGREPFDHGGRRQRCGRQRRHSVRPRRARSADRLTKSTTTAGMGNLPRIVYFDRQLCREGRVRSTVEANAKALAADRTRKIAVEGHTDERGGHAYNLALGQKRAEAVATSMTLMGANDGQIEAVSFGKERPAVPGSDEAAWAKNRRAELTPR